MSGHFGARPRAKVKAYAPPNGWTRLVKDGVVLAAVPLAEAAEEVAKRWADIGLVVIVRKPGGAK